MNIKEELLADQNQSKELALRIAEYAVLSPKNFSELMTCFISDEARLTQRAAWSVSWAAQKRPDMIEPHIGTLVSQLKRTDVHDAVIRNTVRILQDIKILEIYHGPVMEACFDYIQDRKTPIAIKAFSLTILFNFTKAYPEIKNELRIIIEENMDYETAAYRSRGKKILAKI